MPRPRHYYLPAMSFIQSFPLEILGEIFTAPELDVLDVTSASHVSRWWRDAALEATELWLNVSIRDCDTEHADVVLDHLQRSRCRPICLELLFTSKESPTTSLEIRALLEAVVQPNIRRCRSLTAQATRANWDAILATFGRETYPLLRTLDIMFVHFSTTEHPLRDPGQEITFPLPENHPLDELAVYSMNVGNVVLPQMRALRVGGLLDGLVGTDGRINRCLLDGPQRLELRNLAIPPMQFQTEEESRATSSVVFLKLSRIYASTSPHGTQNDCAPFFDALQTPLIRTLELEKIYGRAWEDFLFALNTPKQKYPFLAELLLTSFDFQRLSYAGVAFFLSCFPGLETVVLSGGPSSTWESVWHVLMLHPSLCPSVGAVEANGVLLNREEPLPFACACLLEEPKDQHFSRMSASSS
ncbi:hypothetical protein DFH07DRAFT_55749 [Mycena maculata]|uniref:F-box domain-containing protein n=1 Tax=Mycena maculata TaxID=230809 RepID=A0AAD7IEZ7_9AGAR|nr:hypothetical protein DFH07DRAFT_55749 [Mycena maculata]